MNRRLPRNTLLRHLVLAAGARVLAGVVVYLVDPFPDYELAAVGLFAVAAAGLTILIGLNGQLSLGHGALMAVGGYTTSLLLKQNADLPPPLVMLASVGMAALAAAVVGAAAARLRGPYLAGATLALAVGLPGITLRFSGIFGGDQGISVPRWRARFPGRRLPRRALARLRVAGGGAGHICASGQPQTQPFRP